MQCIVANDDNASTATGATAIINILANDTVKPSSGCTMAEAEVSLVGNVPAGATLDPTTKAITYTGTAAGIITVDYSLCCGKMCDTATVTINVIDLPDNVTSVDCFVGAVPGE